MTLEDFLKEWNNDSDRVLVHTSGSTGTPKPMWVEKRRMEASARITCDFLGLREGDTALLCMSLDYIAGKMMVVRSLVRNLKLMVVEPTGHPMTPLQLPRGGGQDPEQDTPPRGSWRGVAFAAMVPMQVWNSLQVPEERERLRRIGHLIIGGGAIDEALARELRDFPNNVWSTYGMTETLSHIALRRLNGKAASEWYTPFSGVGISQNEDGCLVIDAPQVHDGLLVTNDIVEIRETDGTVQFRVLGRKDNVICSGGIKIQTEEVERTLKPHVREPFLITKRKDAKFGEIVVMMVEGQPDRAALQYICQQHLPRYWQPRDFVFVDKLPMTETGKPARKRAEEMVRESEFS